MVAEQRSAIKIELSMASGISENNSAISSEVFKYCSSEYFLGRLGSSSRTPSLMQTRVS